MQPDGSRNEIFQRLVLRTPQLVLGQAATLLMSGKADDRKGLIQSNDLVGE